MKSVPTKTILKRNNPDNPRVNHLLHPLNSKKKNFKPLLIIIVSSSFLLDYCYNIRHNMHRIQ